MTPQVQDAITSAANQAGIDPAFALAVADRESNGNPDAHASRTMYGLYQMSGANRAQYGGSSEDPGDQAQAGMRFYADAKKDMASRLGRDPTNQELYLGGYFGPARAARMISGQVAPSTDVRDVFTPQELAANPNIGKARTVGALMSSVEDDIGRREANFGNKNGGNNPVIAGQSPANAGPNFAAFGVGANGDAPRGQAAGLTYKSAPMVTTPQPVDFAAFGEAPSDESAPVVTADDTAATAPTEEEPAEALAGLPPAETPAAAGRQHMMMQALGMAPGTVEGISAVPGQQAQTQGPLPQPQRGAQLAQPEPVGPVPAAQQGT